MSDCSVKVLRRRVESPKVLIVVDRLCHSRPSVKGDYRLLTYFAWKDYYGINISLKTFDQIRCAPSPETLGRRYRELNAAWKAEHSEAETNPYAPSMETRLKRSKNYRVYRDYFARMAESQTGLAGFVNGSID